ncbi:Lrp/AsnC family transcriptional regulator [bacterium]|nr:Lrp/AsnC family transcriptional regulator [bacterium]
MDRVDYKILELLQENARIANSEIAKQVGMVPSGVLERIRKLEEKGHIEGYTARVSPASLNLGLLAFLFVGADEPVGGVDTAKKLAKFQEVLEIHHVAGEDCYLVKLRLRDNQELATFMREKIASIPTITSTRSIIVLETIKETSELDVSWSH